MKPEDIIRRRAKFAGLNLQIYDNPAFDSEQLLVIIRGLQARIPKKKMLLLADPRFCAEQMHVILQGLEKGLDVHWLLDPRLPSMDMSLILEVLAKGLDPTEMTDPELSYSDRLIIACTLAQQKSDLSKCVQSLYRKRKKAVM